MTSFLFSWIQSISHFPLLFFSAPSLSHPVTFPFLSSAPHSAAAEYPMTSSYKSALKKPPVLPKSHPKTSRAMPISAKRQKGRQMELFATGDENEWRNIYFTGKAGKKISKTEHISGFI